jgi:ferric-dicitrate binding protein FerR (iron transport regulator)
MSAMFGEISCKVLLSLFNKDFKKKIDFFNSSLGDCYRNDVYSNVTTDKIFMNNDNIWSHITRRISGDAEEEDVNQVDEWLKEKPVNKQIYNRLSDMWNSGPRNSENHQSLFDSILRRIKVYENRPNRPFYSSVLFKAAAILVLVLASNFLVYELKTEEQVVAPVVYQEIVVPRGNRMRIILPDSTSIWLNNETKLRYASNFGKGNREVELSGEGFFDVHHDARHPFIVKVGEQKIKVLGTRFSVNAYPEDKFIETSLIEGSVAFESKPMANGNTDFLLKPGYRLTYNKENSKITTQRIQSSYYQYWEKGVYAFKDESFESLAVKIKRIFNVEVVFENEFLKKKTYTGTININDNIFLFMEAIRRTSVEPIEYKFNKNIIYVKLKN